MFWMVNILGVFFLGVLLAGIMIPQILLISFRKKLFDEPDERKIHTSVVPRLGGIAFLPVIFICMSLAVGIDLIVGEDSVFLQLSYGFKTISFCSSAMMILYIVGMADDLIGIKYRAKFVAQLICAFMLISGGLAVNDFHGVLFIGSIPMWIACPFTVLLAVFIINAINLIDGVDGLASGLSSVALVTYGTVFYLTGQYICSMVCAATFGVIVQFFYYNVFGNPNKQKKIFMGDTGALTIGLILAIMSFKLIDMKAVADIHKFNLVVVAFSPLVIPCFDVIRVYFYRIRHGNNPFLPDKNHIHHRLLDLGFSQRVTMMTIIAASIAFTVVNVLLSRWLNVNLVILLDIVVWTVAMSILPGLIKRHARKFIKK